MNDNFFLDRDGTPLTGKIPLQISLQGDCSALRSQANSELTTFLTDLRLSGLPQMRRTTQLIGGTMEIVHTYGVTQVTLVTTGGSEPKKDEFWGGIALEWGHFTDLTHSTWVVGQAAASSGRTAGLPGRPAIPGTKKTDQTTQLILQIHPTKDLAVSPIKNDAIRIWRAKDVLYGEVVELLQGTDPNTYLLSTNVRGHGVFLKGKKILNIPDSPISADQAVATAQEEYFVSTRLLRSVLLSYGVDKTKFDKTQTLTSGVIVLFTLDMLLAIDLSKPSPAWVTLAQFSPPSEAFKRTSWPVGRSVTSTTTNGVTTITVGKAPLSEFTVSITRSGTATSLSGSIQLRDSEARDAYTPGQTTHTFSYKVLPQVELTDEFDAWDPKYVASGANYTLDPDMPAVKYTRRVKYKAYGFETTASVVFDTPAGRTVDYPSAFTGVVRPGVPTPAYHSEWHWTQSCSDFKGYHYRLKGFDRTYNTVTGEYAIGPQSPSSVDWAVSEGLYSFPLVDLTWSALFTPFGSYGYAGRDGNTHTAPPDASPLFFSGARPGYTDYYDARNPGGAYKFFHSGLTHSLGQNPDVAKANYLYQFTHELSSTYEYPPTGSPTSLHVRTPAQFTTQADYGWIRYYQPTDPPGFFVGTFCIKDGQAGISDHGSAVSDVDFPLYLPSLTGALPDYPDPYPPEPYELFHSARELDRYPRRFTQFGTVGGMGISEGYYSLPGFPNWPFSWWTFANGAADLQLKRKAKDGLPIAAYPKRAAIFGFTETLTMGSFFSMTRTGEVVADEYLAEALPTNVESFPTITAPSTIATYDVEDYFYNYFSGRGDDPLKSKPLDQDTSIDSYLPDHHMFSVGVRINPGKWQHYGEAIVPKGRDPDSMAVSMPDQSGKASYMHRADSYSNTSINGSGPYMFIAMKTASGVKLRDSLADLYHAGAWAYSGELHLDPSEGWARYLCLNPLVSHCPGIEYRVDTPAMQRATDYVVNTNAVMLWVDIIPAPILQVAYLGRNTGGAFTPRRLVGGVVSPADSPAPTPDILDLDTHDVSGSTSSTPVQPEKVHILGADLFVDARTGGYIGHGIIGNQTSEVTIDAVIAEWLALGEFDPNHQDGLRFSGRVSLI